MTNEEALKQFAKVVNETAEKSKSIDKSWHGIADLIGRAAQKAESGLVAAIAKQLGMQSKLVTGLTTIRNLLLDPASADKLARSSETRWRNAQAKLTALIHEINTGQRAYTVNEHRKLVLLQAQIPVLQAQAALHAKMAEILQSSPAYVVAMLSAFKHTAQWTDKMQESLMEGNSALSTRFKLMEDIAKVQISTGANQEVQVEVNKALLKYGMDLKNTFKANAEIVTKMRQGLGVSADTSAEMLALTNRMGASGQGVADAIARVKADTALSAENAAKFATEIARAMSVVSPRAGAGLAGVAEYIGRLEGAATALGIQAGSMKDMMIGLTKPTGMMGVGMIGMSPGFIGKAGGPEEAFKRIVAITEQATAGMDDWARINVLQQYAEIFGTTTEVLANGRKILEEHNQQSKTQLDLQKEWQNQTSTFSQAWMKLKNQMWGLMQNALLPLIKVGAGAVNILSKLATAIADNSPFRWAFNTIVYVAIPLVTWKVISFTRELWKLTAALTAAKIAAAREKMQMGMDVDLPKGFWNRFFSFGKAGLGKFWGGFKNLMPTFAKWLTPKAGGMGTQLLGRLVPHLARFGIGAVGTSAALIAGAGAIGYGVGSLFRLIPGVDKSVQRLITGVAEMTGIWKKPSTVKELALPPDVMTTSGYMQTIRDKLKAGESQAEINKWITANASRVDQLYKIDDKAKRERFIAAMQKFAVGVGAEHVRATSWADLTFNAENSMKWQEKQYDAIHALEQNTEIRANIEQELFKKDLEQKAAEFKRQREEDAKRELEARMYASRMAEAMGRAGGGRWR